MRAMQDFILTKGQKAIVKRNKEIWEMKAKGFSLAQIGRRYNISRQRVWQILSLSTPRDTKVA